MLPEMTVEARDSDTGHGLIPFAPKGSPEYAQELSDMLVLCQDAKSDSAFWADSTMEILTRYAPYAIEDIAMRVYRVTGFTSWRECVDFVRDDECIDFAVMVAKYAKSEGLMQREDRDFIDGGGLGYYQRWLDRTKRTLEKAFDAKYYFKRDRPLVDLIDVLGDKADCIVNYMHPGHYAYPAGHGAKFFETVDLARDSWDMSEGQDRAILTAGYVLSMARSGGGVHFPMDNVVSGYLAGLPEFKQYGK